MTISSGHIGARRISLPASSVPCFKKERGTTPRYLCFLGVKLRYALFTRADELSRTTIDPEVEGFHIKGSGLIEKTGKGKGLEQKQTKLTKSRPSVMCSPCSEKASVSGVLKNLVSHP
jgi:hypothetical protein